MKWCVPEFSKDGRPHVKEDALIVLRNKINYCDTLLNSSKAYVETHYAHADNLYVTHRYYNPMTYLFFVSKEDYMSLFFLMPRFFREIWLMTIDGPRIHTVWNLIIRNATENFIPTVLIAVSSASGLSKKPELQDMILTLMQINHILFHKSVHLHKNKEWLLLERIDVKTGFWAILERSRISF